MLVAAVAALAGTAAAQETTLPAAAPAGPPAAQAPAGAATTAQVEETGWDLNLSGALYVLPDEEDYVQPTFKADHGLFHFETRYNYEDRDSASFFLADHFTVVSLGVSF